MVWNNRKKEKVVDRTDHDCEFNQTLDEVVKPDVAVAIRVATDDSAERSVTDAVPDGT